jgi:patatin-like phospholipase/acyl hydrolase
MANITVFDTTRGDVVLTAALLTRIRNGTFALTVFADKGDVKINKPVADAIVAGTTSLVVVAPHKGGHKLDKDSLAALT